MQEGVDFTVDRSAGVITFTSAPMKGAQAFFEYGRRSGKTAQAVEVTVTVPHFEGMLFLLRRKLRRAFARLQPGANHTRGC